MNRQKLHDLLTGPLGLHAEVSENAVSRTYFYQRIDWRPQQSTRVLRVLFGPNGDPFRIQLCASSDNNNSVLMEAPFEEALVTERAKQEIALLERRLQPQQLVDGSAASGRPAQA